MKSQELRKIAPEIDPLRIGTGWSVADLSKPQIMIESTYGDSHPGSVGLLDLAIGLKKGSMIMVLKPQNFSLPIFVMVRHKGMTVSIIL